MPDSKPGSSAISFIMFMLLAPVVHALEVWCEELTRIFGASQPPHCGHVFRMGEGPTPRSTLDQGGRSRGYRLGSTGPGPPPVSCYSP